MDYILEIFLYPSIGSSGEMALAASFENLLLTHLSRCFLRFKVSLPCPFDSGLPRII